MIPIKQSHKVEQSRFQLTRYITEARVQTGSNLIDATVGELERICDNEVNIIAMIRHKRNRLAPSTSEIIHEGDVLVLQGDSDTLRLLFENPGLVQLVPEDLNRDPAELEKPETGGSRGHAQFDDGRRLDALLAIA